LLLKFLFICSFKLSFSEYYGNPCTWRTWWT